MPWWQIQIRDAVGEFRVLESNYSAEYGRNAGGIVSVVTKSGTNTLHGTAYDYVRNNDFDANPFFNNEQGLPVPVLKRNQFGATIGGPVVLPKIVNGRNKLFFFFSYEGQRQSALDTSPGKVTTYTPAEATGDFSALGPPGSNPVGNISDQQPGERQSLLPVRPHQGRRRHHRPQQDRPRRPSLFRQEPDPHFCQRVFVSASPQHRQLQRVPGKNRLQHHFQGSAERHLHFQRLPAAAAILRRLQCGWLSGHLPDQHLLRRGHLQPHLHSVPVKRTQNYRPTALASPGGYRQQPADCQPAWSENYARQAATGPPIIGFSGKRSQHRRKPARAHQGNRQYLRPLRQRLSGPTAATAPSSASTFPRIRTTPDTTST